MLKLLPHFIVLGLEKGLRMKCCRDNPRVTCSKSVKKIQIHWPSVWHFEVKRRLHLLNPCGDSIRDGYWKWLNKCLIYWTCFRSHRMCNIVYMYTLVSLPENNWLALPTFLVFVGQEFMCHLTWGCGGFDLWDLTYRNLAEGSDCPKLRSFPVES